MWDYTGGPRRGEEMWKIMHRIDYWSLIYQSLQSAQEALPEVIPTEQTQTVLNQIKGLVDVGITNIQKTDSQMRNIPPPLEYLQNYASRVGLSV